MLHLILNGTVFNVKKFDFFLRFRISLNFQARNENRDFVILYKCTTVNDLSTSSSKYTSIKFHEFLCTAMSIVTLQFFNCDYLRYFYLLLAITKYFRRRIKIVQATFTTFHRCFQRFPQNINHRGCEQLLTFGIQLNRGKKERRKITIFFPRNVAFTSTNH